jgi:hypothetical protein
MQLHTIGRDIVLCTETDIHLHCEQWLDCKSGVAGGYTTGTAVAASAQDSIQLVLTSSRS